MASRSPLASIFPGQIRGSIYSITDSFGSNGGDLSGRATETGGKTWEVLSGTWGVTATGAGYAVKTISNNANQSAVIDAGQANMDAYVTFVAPTPVFGAISPGCALCFRAVDDDNKWVISWNTGPDSLIVYSVESGAFTSRAVYASGIDASPYGHTIRVIASGDSITTYWDATNLGSITSSIHNTATKVGLHSYDQAAKDLDNFDYFAVALI